MKTFAGGMGGILFSTSWETGTGTGHTHKFFPLYESFFKTTLRPALKKGRRVAIGLPYAGGKHIALTTCPQGLRKAYLQRLNTKSI